MTDSSDWRKVAQVFVGGLTEVGFAGDERFLLVVSFQGRGVIDCASGARVARDVEAPRKDSVWLDADRRIVQGIGPIEGKDVPCVGLWGGALPERFGDWSVVVTPSNGADEITLRNDRTGTVRLLQTAITDVRAAGFSPTGQLLVIATTSEIEVFRSS